MTSKEIQEENNPQILHERLSSKEIRKAERRLIKRRLWRMSRIDCPVCEGDGRIAIGENFVSHDMAIDAGEPSMEGRSMGIEYAKCEACYGKGWLFRGIEKENYSKEEISEYGAYIKLFKEVGK